MPTTPTVYTQQKSGSEINTWDGIETNVEGEQESSPAKLFRVGPCMNNDASQNTFMRLLDTTKLLDHIHSEQIIPITDSGLESSAAILRSDPVNLSLEEKGIASDDHHY